MRLAGINVVWSDAYGYQVLPPMQNGYYEPIKDYCTDWKETKVSTDISEK